MKVFSLGSLLVVLVVSLWSLGASASPALVVGTQTQSVVPRLMGVRAEYEDLSGNHPHTNTTCFLVNKSFTQPITIQVVSVLGPGGRTDLLGNHPTIQGTVIEPLGELRIPIDNSIPGVVPQVSADAHGVRTVYVRWTGPQGALNLSATILRHPTGQIDVRDRVLEQGFEVIP